MNIQEVLLTAFTISVVLKLLYSIEEFFMMHSWMSVKVENQIGALMVKVHDMNGQECHLSFNSLADYKRWIKNHITAANEIVTLAQEPEDSEE